MLLFSRSTKNINVSGQFYTGVTLTDTFFCKFIYKWLSHFGIPVPCVNLQDVLSGLNIGFGVDNGKETQRKPQKAESIDEGAQDILKKVTG